MEKIKINKNHKKRKRCTNIKVLDKGKVSVMEVPFCLDMALLTMPQGAPPNPNVLPGSPSHLPDAPCSLTLMENRVLGALLLLMWFSPHERPSLLPPHFADEFTSFHLLCASVSSSIKWGLLEFLRWCNGISSISGVLGCRFAPQLGTVG